MKKKEFNYNFKKISKLKGKYLANVESRGSFNLKIEKESKQFSIENLKYFQEGIKNPLIFKVVNWEFDVENKQLKITKRDKNNFRKKFLIV